MSRFGTRLAVENAVVIVFYTVATVVMYRTCAILNLDETLWLWGGGSSLIMCVTIFLRSPLVRADPIAVWAPLVGFPLGAFVDAVIDTTVFNSSRNLFGLEVIAWLLISTVCVSVTVLAVRLFRWVLSYARASF
jgi:disulfide bond formation protein DsbB